MTSPHKPDGQLVAFARNPIPSGAVSGLFKGYDGVPLRFARWDAARSPRRGTVCIFQGRGEFIEKFFETIADLRRRGFAVATYDMRGQGGSHRLLKDPRKGHIRDFAEHDQDLLRFMKDVVLPDCPPPYIALGHSTGGNVCLRNACMEGSWFERMVLSAPLIQLSAKGMSVSPRTASIAAEICYLSGFGDRYVPGGHGRVFEEMAFEGNPLTSDLERFTRNKQLIEQAPHIGVGAPTFGWLRAACRSMRKIAHPEYPSRVRVPLLLIAASSDEVVAPRAIEMFGEALKIGSHVLITGSRHEILQERDEIRQQFWATFDAYLMGDAMAA